MNIYLDIDKTLIYGDGFDVKVANHLQEFLEHCLKDHTVYWLTTHCNGDAQIPVNYMKPYVTKEILDLIIQIRPTSWKLSKSEAIDLSSNFLWFDDLLMPSDEKRLVLANKIESFVKVDLTKDPDLFLKYLAI